MDEPGPGKGFTDATRLSRRSWVLIALYGAGLYLVQFAPPDVLNYHEAFYSEPAREFLLTGDFIAPRIGGAMSW
jgi:hypothetical protein